MDQQDHDDPPSVLEIEPTRVEGPWIDDQYGNGSLYSNNDGVIRPEAVAWLAEHPGYWAPHFAWDYIGYISACERRNGLPAERMWIEVVYQHHAPIAAYACSALETLIQHVIDNHGSA